MGYYTTYEVEVPEAFMALWDMNQKEVREHVEALKKMGVVVDPKKGPTQVTEDLEISLDRNLGDLPRQKRG